MKIMYWSEGFWPHSGGVERFSMQLIQALRKQGHEFLVITSLYPDTAEEEIFEGIKIVRLPMRQGLNKQLDAYKKTIDIISRLKQQFMPDLYHLNVTGPSFYFHLKTAHLHYAPTVFTLHFLLSSIMSKSNLFAEILKYSNWITGGSKATMHSLHQSFPEYYSKSSLIYHGLSKPNITPILLDPHSPYLFSFGRLVENKGFNLMIEAFAVLEKKYPWLQYWIAGQGPDKEQLEKLINQYNLQHKIRLLGHVSDEKLFTLINHSRLVVLPSHDWNECFGLAALEAMQMVKPVITTRHSGLNEVVVENETALLFEPHNINSLINCVEQLLIDNNFAKMLGINGQKRAEMLFGIEQMTFGYECLFQNLVKPLKINIE